MIDQPAAQVGQHPDVVIQQSKQVNVQHLVEHLVETIELQSGAQAAVVDQLVEAAEQREWVDQLVQQAAVVDQLVEPAEQRGEVESVVQQLVEHHHVVK